MSLSSLPSRSVSRGGKRDVYLHYDGSYGTNNTDDFIDERCPEGSIVIDYCSKHIGLLVPNSDNKFHAILELRLGMRAIEIDLYNLYSVLNGAPICGLSRNAFPWLSIRNHSHLETRDCRSGELEKFVFVLVIEIPKNGQWMIGMPCGDGSIARLHEFDSSLNMGTQSLDATPIVGIGRLDPDGEHKTAVIGEDVGRIFMNCDCPNHMIESASQIVEEVGIDERPSSNRRFVVNLDEDAETCKVLIRLRDEPVGLGSVPLINFSVELIEQFFSPV